jgi:Flp pilus assembly protein TadD
MAIETANANIRKRRIMDSMSGNPVLNEGFVEDRAQCAEDVAMRIGGVPLPRNFRAEVAAEAMLKPSDPGEAIPITRRAHMNRHHRRASAKLKKRSVNSTVADMMRLGLESHNAGRLVGAEECYRQVLALRPNYPDALQLLGVVACQLGRYQAATDWIRSAIALDETNPAWFCNLGLALERLGQFEESLASHNKALQLKPGYAEAFNNRGNTLGALGRIDEALASYDQALLLDADCVEALNNRGNILRMLGRSMRQSQVTAGLWN